MLGAVCILINATYTVRLTITPQDCVITTLQVTKWWLTAFYREIFMLSELTSSFMFRSDPHTRLPSASLPFCQDVSCCQAQADNSQCLLTGFRRRFSIENFLQSMQTWDKCKLTVCSKQTPPKGNMHAGTRETIHKSKRARSKQFPIRAKSRTIFSALHLRHSDRASHKGQ